MYRFRTKNLLIFVIVLFISLQSFCTAEAVPTFNELIQFLFPQTSIEVKQSNDFYSQEEAVMALNHCLVSLTKGIIFNDRIILDEEYHNIINNINLTKINEDILSLEQKLMTFLTETSLKSEEKARFEAKYRKKLQRSVISAISNAASGIQGKDAFSITVNGLASVGSAGFNYMNSRADYQEELDDQLWQLKSQQKTRLNYLRQDFLGVAHRLENDYQFPDNLRLTEKQIEDFVTILKDPDSERKYRLLSGIQDSFQCYPPYWFYLGITAKQVWQIYVIQNNINEADKFYSKALNCFEEYEKLRLGLFRQDPYLVSICMNRINMLDKKIYPNQISHDLELMIKNSKKNEWNNFLFAALKYREIGEREKSDTLFQYNVDYLGMLADVKGETTVNNQDITYLIHFNKWLWNKSGASDKANINTLYQSIISDNNTRYMNTLDALGDLTPYELINELRPYISQIKLELTKTAIVDDYLTLTLPINWLIGNVFEEQNILKYQLPKDQDADLIIMDSKNDYPIVSDQVIIESFDKKNHMVTLKIEEEIHSDRISIKIGTNKDFLVMDFDPVQSKEKWYQKVSGIAHKKNIWKVKQVNYRGKQYSM